MSQTVTSATLHDTSRIGIVNRGEAAFRFIRGVREYNSRFAASLRTIALYTAQEEQAPFVKYADDRICFSDLSGITQTAASPYLDHELILAALEAGNCDALWVGWGFVSEDAEFAAKAEDRNLVFLGPSSSAMSLLGDKIAAKDLADSVEVPILPWSRGAVETFKDAARVAEKIGYPIIVKAANAGGGRGIRFVLSPDTLETQYQSAVEETLRVTGTRTVFIERLVRQGRHLEVQVLADRHGNVNTFGVRDCSLQRRNQKIIEETPPPGLPEETTKAMEAAAARLIQAAAYEGAGTVEYLYDLDTGNYYFMEVNTRLQVEHPITEELYGIDLVTGQIEVAFNRVVDLSSAIPRGHVMEARLNAEDPRMDFSPAPGKIALFRPPAGPGIRVDSGIEAGIDIPGEFDSMVAKIIARGRDRKEAASRLKRALDECTIRIEHGTTNRAFLRSLLEMPEVAAGAVSTAYVGEQFKSGFSGESEDMLRAALITGAVAISRRRSADGRINFHNELARLGKPRNMPKQQDSEVSLTVSGNGYKLHVFHIGGSKYHVESGSGLHECRLKGTNGEGTLDFNGNRYRFLMVPRGDALQCEINGTPFLLEQESGGIVKSPSPAIVLSIAVQPGNTVEKGSVIAVLEAMKMEMIIEAPSDGRVVELLVPPGTQVAAGQGLIRMEAADSAEKKPVTEAKRVEFPIAKTEGREHRLLLEQEITALFLGFDCGKSTQMLIDEWKEAINDEPALHEEFCLFIFHMLEIFCAVETLFCSFEIETEEGGPAHSYTSLLTHFALRSRDREKGLPEEFAAVIERALGVYRTAGISDSTGNLLYHIYRSRGNAADKALITRELLSILEELGGQGISRPRFEILSNEIVRLVQSWNPHLADAALHARYVLIDREELRELRRRQRKSIETITDAMSCGEIDEQDERIGILLDSPPSALIDVLRIRDSRTECDPGILTKLAALYLNRDRKYGEPVVFEGEHFTACSLKLIEQEPVLSSITLLAAGPIAGDRFLAALPDSEDLKQTDKREVTLIIPGEEPPEQIISRIPVFPCRFLSIGVYPADDMPVYRTYHPEGDSWQLEKGYAWFSPLEYRELRLWRLNNFDLKVVHRSDNIFVLEGTAKENPKDVRLFALGSTSETDPELSPHKDLTKMVRIERMFMEAIYGLRAAQQKYRYRLQWNRIILYNRSLLGLRLMQLREFGLHLVPRTAGLGLEKMTVYSRRKRWWEETIREHALIFHHLSADQFSLRSRRPSTRPLEPLDRYGAKVVRSKQLGQIYPYELIQMVTHSGYPLYDGLPRGEFEEFDIEFREEGVTVPVSVKGREPGNNDSNIVFGRISNHDPVTNMKIQRILILSDPTRGLGSLAEEECRRIIAALDLAEKENIPVEWVPVSSGAKITMDSGTENLDWTAAALKRIVEFTQAGGEINIIVQSINVGAQSYWNAESTMLMHTRGLLLMTDDAAMLLTGKRALDFSGSVSGESNIDIGGAEKIMLPNGQAQIRVANLAEAYKVLFRHYRLSYTAPGEHFPRPLPTKDPAGRDITEYPYKDLLGQGFQKIGDIFSKELNPDRKKPFDMRQVMRAIVDTDSEILERWRNLKGGETAVVWETRLGGLSVGMIGIESRNFPRIGGIPCDGPDTWSGGTLYPRSSKKVARGINAFSGRLPLVMIANLSGFDGSPESLRRLQLEYGAEIGRAMVNFAGPIIFMVVARYHGGAYVVFSKRLNPMLEVAALEGSFASVIGGAPAAAVVFPKKVRSQTEEDPRIIEMRKQLDSGRCSIKDFEQLYQSVYNEHQTSLGQQFDTFHSVERAKEVGSIDTIIKASEMRPYLIDAVKRGMDRNDGSR